MQVDVTQDDNPSDAITITGFWRRLGAFMLDGLLLGTVGAVLAYFFFDYFISLGGWGKLLGFVIALLYFGFADSALSNGQSLGKRLLKIRVTDGSGNPLPLSKSVMRYMVFGVPYFLNGAQIRPDVLMSWVGGVVAFCVFGLGLSLLYLFLFNRMTRQSLHDLAVGSFVVSAHGSGAVPHAPIWRGHFVVVGVLLVLASLSPIAAKMLVKVEPFEDLLKVQSELQKEPEVSFAGVTANSFTGSSTNTGTKTTHGLSANVVLRKEIIDYDAFANRLARVVLTSYPGAASKDAIQVSCTYGFDIGIASAWRNRNFSFSPAQWQSRIAAVQAGGKSQ